MGGWFRVWWLLLAVAIACEGKHRKFGPATDPAMVIEGSNPTGAFHDAGDEAGSNENSSDAPLIAGGANLQVEPDQLAFGSVVLGFAALGRVTISNGGSDPIMQVTIGLSPESDPAVVIAQNRCSIDLAAGASCEVWLQFLPAVIGSVNGVLNVTSAGQRAAVVISGAGVEQGDLLLLPADGSSADFGPTLLGTPVEASFRIDNPLDVESGVISFDLANPAFLLQPPAAGDCQPGITSLMGGESCTVRIAFQPTERGRNEATLTAISASLGSTSIGVQGLGLAPGALALDRTSHDFAGVVLGSAGQFNLTVGNLGDVALTLTRAGLAVGSDAAFSVISSDCGAGTVLGGEGGGSCNVQLEFRPTSVAVAMGALAISAEGTAEQLVTLRGEGLLPGSLVVVPEGNGSADFGQLLIGATATRRFRVTNPGAEPSGAVSSNASGGFEVLAPSAADDCEPGVTNLVDGGSCFLSVRLAASARGPIGGALTVSSALAGSTNIDLQAIGLLPATLVVDREAVDFGRVVRGTRVEASVTVRNTGDVPMPVPTLSLGTATSGQSSAFRYESSCAGSVAPGDDCAVAVYFSPTQASAHSVTLNFASNPGGSSSVLLVARVIDPGSLVLQPAQGSSANFGDVAINSSVTRNFVLSNPGGEPSGRITLTTNDARFSPSIGNCNPAGGGGLVDGSSCTFSVTFTPNSSEALSASLNATSPGAGDTALSLSGRGRNAARLTGSNDFNFNTVIRGESATSRTWTVTNDGDLASGTLTTTGGNNEFIVTSNTCIARTLGGGQTCTMLVGFTPQGNNERSGTITVSDGTSTATLTVRGIGQPLPAVGSPCLDGRCARTATCENHSNGRSLVCCAENCTGNQRCSEDEDFEGCELPSVGQGQGCGASVLCNDGLTCNATTQTCCVSNCTGACRACNVNGTCGNVPDGQRGGCAVNQVCAGGVCGTCTPNDRRCNPNNNRIPQVCSATGVFQDQMQCPFVCQSGVCGGECLPNSRRCDPATGRPQVCNVSGVWGTPQAACPTGSACSVGECLCVQGFDECNDVCVDLDTNASNCGECGRSCFPQQGGTCTAGNCNPTPLATGELVVAPPLLSDTHVYWTTGGSNLVRRVPRNGGNVQTVFTGQSGLSGGTGNLVIVGDQLYFSNGVADFGQAGTLQVMRSNLDGSNVSGFSPAYSGSTITSVAASDGSIFHAVLPLNGSTTNFYRAPVLGAVQAGAGVQTDLGLINGRIGVMTAAAGCIFYTTQAALNQIIRKCTAAAGTMHYTGNGNVFFHRVGSSDSTDLFFTDNNGVSRIGLAAGSTVVRLGNVTPGAPVIDPFDATAIYYFAQTGSFGAPACTAAHTLFRFGKQIGSGNPVVLVPPPQDCPIGPAVAADALYWANREGLGTIMKLAK